MRKSSILVAVLLVCSHIAFGQYYYNDKYFESEVVFEFGGSLGGMNCITDLGGSKGGNGLYFGDINYSQTKWTGGLYFGVMFRNLAGARLEGTIGSVGGADSVLKGATTVSGMNRFNRNLNFSSHISEVTLLGEFYPLGIIYGSDAPSKFAPYIAAGFGWYSFNPQARVNGKTVNLRPLRLEGQGFNVFPGTRQYRTTQLNIPVGVGLKYELSSLFNLRVEFLHRILFTDHLDDVGGVFIDPSLFAQHLPEAQAQLANEIYGLSKVPIPVGEARGNSRKNDSFMSLSLKLGMTIGRPRR